jgi:quercetin dioxygenase-like cupin family protein
MAFPRTCVRASIWLGSILAVLLVTRVPGSAQQSPPAPAAGNNFQNNFTGKIAVVDSKEMRSARIRFEAGARTNWHVHSAPQLILVEEGRGLVYEAGSGKVIVLKAGESFLTKPNVLHWHGAAADSHAVQFSVYSGTLDWKEPVTDDEYSGRKAR